MGLDALKEDLTKLVKEAVEDIQSEAAEDFETIQTETKKVLMDIVQEIASGKSIQEVVEEHDTKTKALAAAALFKLAKNQQIALTKLESVLKGITGIVLRAVLLKLGA